MLKYASLAAITLVLGACAKPPPEDTCKAPDFAPKAAAGTFAGEKEAATLCARKAAFAIAKGGGDVSHAGVTAAAQCAAEEAAIGKKSGETLYDYQRALLHDALVHTAQITATQARATGCGLPPGAAKDTI